MNNKYITNLMDTAKKGNFNSFLLLADVYVGSVYSLCLKCTAQPKLAESLTVNTFLSSWNLIKNLPLTDNFLNWLYGITVFNILEELRSRNIVSELIEKKEIPSISPPEELLLNSSKLEAMIYTLPEDDRVMFVLFEVMRYSASEISDIMPKYRPDEVQNIIRSIRIHFIEELNK